MHWRATLLLAGTLALSGATPGRAQSDTASGLHELVAGARAPLARWPDFSRHLDEVTRLYAARGDAPLWLDGTRLTQAGREALRELDGANAHGLDPRDYDAPTLDSLTTLLPLIPRSPGDLAQLDLLLTVGVIRYLDDLRSGRMAPAPFERERGGRAPLAAALDSALQGDSVARMLGDAAPRLTQYRNLQRLLARYRQLASDSALAAPSAGRTVYPGERYQDIAALRRLLTAIGDGDGGLSGASRIYGPADAAAVRRFQLRHGLTPDGILGPATFAALDTPLSHRVRQIELALERLRWLPPLRAGQRFVVVNIPAFELFAFDSAGGTGTPALDMRIVVGMALDRRTPLLFEQMRYVEFRPFWNVPLSIFTGELLPLLRRDPEYLRAHDMEIVGPRDLVLGDSVDAHLLRRLSRGELRIRQRPGVTNALGPVKFVFPNADAVYLHGTPESELFARERRDLSHGCVRVEDPAALAAWVLRDHPEWGRDAIEAAMHGAETVRAPLVRPIPVAIFYTTAVARPDGGVRFYPDIYGLDRALDQALRAAPAPP